MAKDAGMPDSIIQSPCRPLRGLAFISMSTSTQAGSEPPQRNCRPRAATHSLPHERIHSVEQMSATNVHHACCNMHVSTHRMHQQRVKSAKAGQIRHRDTCCTNSGSSPPRRVKTAIVTLVAPIAGQVRPRAPANYTPHPPTNYTRHLNCCTVLAARVCFFVLPCLCEPIGGDQATARPGLS